MIGIHFGFSVEGFSGTEFGDHFVHVHLNFSFVFCPAPESFYLSIFVFGWWGVTATVLVGNEEAGDEA